MDIISKKLSFVQEFLRISDEDLIVKFERLLRSERKKKNCQRIQTNGVESFL